MPTPAGYASCSYELRNAAVSRTAFVTFGIDPTATDPTTVATFLVGAYNAAGSIKSEMDSDTTLVRAHVSLGTDGTEDIVGDAASGSAGSKAGLALPGNVAVLVHKRSARGGRRGRGRLYWPWMLQNTDYDENGNIKTSRITTIQAAMNAWLAALNTNPGPMVILHRPSQPGIDNPTTPGAPNVVTSLTVDPLVGTQRRRLGR